MKVQIHKKGVHNSFVHKTQNMKTLSAHQEGHG